LLTGIRGGGALEKYIAVRGLEPFINKDLVLERLVPFRLLEVEGLEKAVKGLPADLMIEVCQGFVAALQASFDPNSPYPKMTDRQRQMAMRASMFLSACAKVGLEALIDEATGYQYERAEDALQVKLRAFIADELRAWEKTFPDELWTEFGRLTGWKGNLHSRPKWWGKLVIEMIYDTQDPDIAEYLKATGRHPLAPAANGEYRCSRASFTLLGDRNGETVHGHARASRKSGEALWPSNGPVLARSAEPKRRGRQLRRKTRAATRGTDDGSKRDKGACDGRVACATRCLCESSQTR
jgi:hypothetical protein